MQKAIFAHLLPLTSKLSLETNPRKKELLKNMIHEIEKETIAYIKNEKTTPEFTNSLTQSLRRADEALSPGWRKLLDKVLNAIIRVFSKKEQNLGDSSHSFFKKPNVLTDEVTNASQEIIRKKSPT